jgi:TonB family protein
VLWLLAAGVVARLVWLAAGFWKLRLFRRRSVLMEMRDGVALLLSGDIASPVTFGARRPVILLPAQFPALDPRTREAILCHELLHVRRRDWVFTVAEELIRAAWWFHPAVWWLLGQVQLAREQAVDRQVIETTQAREEYIDALLAIAGARPRLDLAPAPLFLRQRHLKQRVVSIVQEVRMSKTRLISSFSAAVAVLAAACWLVTLTFPLAAAPDTVADAPGVTVDLNGATLLHRTPVLYPSDAQQHGVQGVVTVQLRLDSNGNVSDAQVVSGPEELRKPVLESVLSWHFTRDLAGSTRQTMVAFSLGTLEAQPAAKASAPAPVTVAPGALDRTVKSLNFIGLTDESRSALLSRLPVHEGDTLSPETLRQLVQTVHNFDEHLAVTTRPVSGDGAAVYIIVPQGPFAAPPPPPLPNPAALDGGGPPRIRVGGNVQSTKLVFQPKPMYPPLAKQGRIQGTVQLHAVIGKDGAVQDLSVISGHPLLVGSALEAVRQWVYQPTLLNGSPTEVETEIDVNYTLSQ